ncbi:hypothetical protein [Gelidibacter gilvus]|uniref:Uncharacterized protein n=1 Tax=Gelidibacter gilvus TaxID=59602 RepID=A0A4Q0XL11_9FLAO|nr:hypothetical protein [Gelidibacter gilvus]RXJ52257.1 hypothetical protein ESZ48_00725 [Gelidibacter gilvus]
MRKSTFVLKLAVLFLLLTAFTCDDQDDRSCEDYVSKLEDIRTKIETLVETSECNKDLECHFLAFGSKPCGGPWSYLVYSTAIDTLELRSLVDAYNKMEQEYNVACQQYSDCMFVSPPLRLECENNKCIAIY